MRKRLHEYYRSMRDGDRERQAEGVGIIRQMEREGDCLKIVRDDKGKPVAVSVDPDRISAALAFLLTVAMDKGAKANAQRRLDNRGAPDWEMVELLWEQGLAN